MRVVILGASGMLGHQIYRHLCKLSDFEVFGTVRKFDEELSSHGGRVIAGVDLTDPAAIHSLLEKCRPEAVINCAGLTPKHAMAQDPGAFIQLNALVPHQLKLWTQQRDVRLIHFSTDAVFDGRGGPYHEECTTTAEDLYGKTKALGEIAGSKTLTIRASLLGPELRGHTELFDWLLAQNGKTIKSNQSNLYTGVTTVVMARLVSRLLLDFPGVNGLHQIAGRPITHHDLLVLIRDTYKLFIEILPDNSQTIDRRLNGDRFLQITGLSIPDWPDMIRELKTLTPRSRREVFSQIHT